MPCWIKWKSNSEVIGNCRNLMEGFVRLSVTTRKGWYKPFSSQNLQGHVLKDFPEVQSLFSLYSITSNPHWDLWPAKISNTVLTWAWPVLNVHGQGHLLSLLPSFNIILGRRHWSQKHLMVAHSSVSMVIQAPYSSICWLFLQPTTTGTRICSPKCWLSSTSHILLPGMPS